MAEAALKEAAGLSRSSPWGCPSLVPAEGLWAILVPNRLDNSSKTPHLPLVSVCVERAADSARRRKTVDGASKLCNAQL